MPDDVPTTAAVVTADDFALFYCHVEATGAIEPRRQWIYATSSVRYVGPTFVGPLTPDKIRDAVNACWLEKTK